jgi:hypothetical protein
MSYQQVAGLSAAFVAADVMMYLDDEMAGCQTPQDRSWYKSCVIMKCLLEAACSPFDANDVYITLGVIAESLARMEK